MTAQSIPELTNYEYNELSYNSASTLITGTYMTQICELLDKCGFSVKYTTTYDETLADAVFRFQETAKINATGILTTTTLQAMIVYADKMSDTIEGDDKTTDDESEDESDSPHYNSFFDEENYKTHRKNHKDIKIVFGNNSITKTIKDVFMRSVTVEVDTSGNPISEIYEFVARDIVESDEILDTTKYTSEGEGYSSSDIKYKYNFDTDNIVSNNDNDGAGSFHSSESGRSHGGGGRGF